jgi:hypothetical protein
MPCYMRFNENQLYRSQPLVQIWSQCVENLAVFTIGDRRRHNRGDADLRLQRRAGWTTTKAKSGPHRNLEHQNDGPPSDDQRSLLLARLRRPAMSAVSTRGPIHKHSGSFELAGSTEQRYDSPECKLAPFRWDAHDVSV